MWQIGGKGVLEAKKKPVRGPTLGSQGTWGLKTYQLVVMLAETGHISSREEGTNTWPPALTPATSSSLPGTVLLQPALETVSQTQELISVMLKVPSVLPPYRHPISVSAGSSLEDVLKKAQELAGFT